MNEISSEKSQQIAAGSQAMISASEYWRLVQGTTAVTGPIELRGWIYPSSDSEETPTILDLNDENARIAAVGRFEQNAEGAYILRLPGIHKDILIKDSDCPDSDCIDFGVDYSAADIQGDRSIVQYQAVSGQPLAFNATSRFYETTGNDAVVGRLSFAQKYRLKITAESKEGSWQMVGTPTGGSYEFWNLCHYNGNLYTMSYNSGQLLKFNGASWETVGSAVGGGNWWNLCHNGADFYSIRSNGQLYKFNGSLWETMGSSVGDTCCALCYDGANFYTIKRSNGQVYKFNTTSWITIGNAGSSNEDWTTLVYDGANLYSTGQSSGQLRKFDYASWTNIGSSASQAPSVTANNWQTLCYDGSAFYATEYKTGRLYKFTGSSWVKVGANTPKDICGATDWYALFFVNAKVYALGYSGMARQLFDLNRESRLRFSNLRSETADYLGPNRQELVVYSEQISNNKDSAGNYGLDFEMTNIRLISARIFLDRVETPNIAFDISTEPGINQNSKKILMEAEPGEDNQLTFDELRLDLPEGSTVLSDFVCDSENVDGKIRIGVRANLTPTTPVALEGDWSEYRSGSFETSGTGTLKIGAATAQNDPNKPICLPQSNITIRDGAALEFTGNLDYTTAPGSVLDLRGCSGISGGKSLTLGAGARIIF